MARPNRVKRWQNPQRETTGAVVRYSHFVVFMRRALLIVAILLGLLIIAWPVITRHNEAPVTKTDNGLIREMLSPRYTGIDNKGQAYLITASRARQPEKSLSIILLDNLSAEMKGPDASWSRLAATTGRYDQTAQTLQLDGVVNVTNSQGYDVNTSTAFINLKQGQAEGAQPVSGTGPMGKINAEGFRISDGGKTIIFTGKPQLNLTTD